MEVNYRDGHSELIVDELKELLKKQKLLLHDPEVESTTIHPISPNCGEVITLRDGTRYVVGQHGEWRRL